MSEFILDLSDYKDTTSAHVPEGRYTVVVEDAETTVSTKLNADTGKPSPGVILYLRVADGDESGATLIDRLWITPKSRFRIVGFMQAIGLPTPKKKLKISLKQFIGKTLAVDVEDGEPYQGRIKSEVRGYARVAGAAKPQAAEPSDLDTGEDDTTEEPVSVTGSGAATAATEDPWTGETAESNAVSGEAESVDLETLDLG